MRRHDRGGAVAQPTANRGEVLPEVSFRSPTPGEPQICLATGICRLPEGALLRRLNRRFQVLNRMMRETGLPRWYIKKRAASLGLTMHQDKRPWTAEEEEILERLLGKLSALTIARRLKRTKASVVLKIKRLGVSRRVRNGYTMRDLETCLGEDHHKIQRWVADGWLRDRLQGTRRHDGNGRDIHRFREKDILGFIRQHPLEINLGRVDAVWFLDMILLKGREFL